VCVCHTPQEVEDGITFLFGECAASVVLIEDFLEGREASFIVATDGERIVPFPSAHDYKRVGDGDRGPNTGGMGTVSPTPNLTAEQESWVCDHVIKPVLGELRRRSIEFRGFLYAGLMISPRGSVNVLEFNARFGDPECQSVMRRLQGDLAQVLFELSAPKGSPRQEIVLEVSDQAAVCVVLASAGYPQAPRKGDTIHGIDLAELLPGVLVFHAGTAFQKDGTLVVNGGRVLNVTALGKDVVEARARAYKAADMIQFRGVQLRRDIGAR
jgi:phosphoribosylamine--glycine ligase